MARAEPGRAQRRQGDRLAGTALGPGAVGVVGARPLGPGPRRQAGRRCSIRIGPGRRARGSAGDRRFARQGLVPRRRDDPAETADHRRADRLGHDRPSVPGPTAARDRRRSRCRAGAGRPAELSRQRPADRPRAAAIAARARGAARPLSGGRARAASRASRHAAACRHRRAFGAARAATRHRRGRASLRRLVRPGRGGARGAAAADLAERRAVVDLEQRVRAAERLRSRPSAAPPRCSFRSSTPANSRPRSSCAPPSRSRPERPSRRRRCGPSTRSRRRWRASCRSARASWCCARA